MRNQDQALGQEDPDVVPATGLRPVMERASFVLLSLFLLLGSIPHGLVTPASRFGFQLFSFLLAALASAFAFRTGGKPVRAVVTLLLIFAGIGVVQILPLPTPIIESVSPASARIYHESGAVLKNSGRETLPMRLSIAPRRTLEATLGILACTALLLSSAILTRTSRRRRIIAGSVVTGVLLQLVYVVAIAQPGRIRGTFVVMNNFASLLAIAFTTAAAFALVERSRSPLRAVFFTLSAVAAGVALVLTRSTGGLAAGVLSLALIFFIERTRGRIRPLVLLVLSLIGPLAGLSATLMFAVKGTSLLQLLPPGPLARESTRVIMWNAALDTWTRFPWLGAGLGAFEDAIRSPSISRAIPHPHHELLHLAVTGGLVSVALAMAALLILWKTLIRAATEASGTDRAMALAALGAVSAITIHGLVDFPLSVPAIAGTLACIAGAGLGAANQQDVMTPSTVYRDTDERSS